MSTTQTKLEATKALLAEMMKEAQELKSAAGGSVTDAVAGWLAAQYLVASREQLSATEGAGRFEVLRTFVQVWARLRHGDHTAERLQLEREHLAEARKDTQLQALEICLAESKQWPEVQKLYDTAFAQFKELRKGKR